MSPTGEKNSGDWHRQRCAKAQMHNHITIKHAIASILPFDINRRKENS